MGPKQRRSELLTKETPYKPYAGKPHVRICAGGARQLASLPLKRRKVSTLFGRGAVEFCSTSVLVVAGTFAVATTASLSDTIDVTTPCPAAVQAFDSPCLGKLVSSMIHASATSAKLFRINKRELKTSKKIPNGI